MKKSKLIILLTTLAFQLASQEVIISEEIPLRSDYAYDILGRFEDEILLLRARDNKYQVHAYAPDLSLSWDREVEIPEKNTKLIGTSSDEESFHMFYQYRKKSVFHIRMAEFDSDLSLIDSAGIFEIEAFLFSPNYEMELSENRRKVLFYDIEQNRDISTIAYDLDKNEVLWESTFTFDDVNLHRDFADMIVSDKGEMYLVVEKENFRTRLDKHKVEIYKYAPGYNNLQLTSLPLDSCVNINMNLKYDNVNERLIFSGIYSCNSNSRGDGIFFFSVDDSDF